MKKKRNIALVGILLGVVAVNCTALAAFLLGHPIAAAAAEKNSRALASEVSEVSEADMSRLPEAADAVVVTEDTAVVNATVPFRPGTELTDTPWCILKSGDRVEVREVTEDWVKAEHEDHVGYLPRYSVHLPEKWVPDVPEEAEEPEAEPVLGAITGSSVRLREHPDTNSTILMDMDRGDAVSILGTEGDWSHVLFGEVEGYVISRFVTTGQVEKVQEEVEQAVEMTAMLPEGSTSNVKAVGLVTGDGVRIRSDANTDSSVLVNVDRGTVVSLMGTKSGWFSVNYDGMNGYMSADYVQAKLTASDINAYGIVTSDDLNMRSGSSSDSAVVTVLNKNTHAVVTGFDKGWYAIRVGDQTGYVSGNYFTPTMKAPVIQQEAPVEETTEPPQEEVSVPETPASGTAADVIAYAEQYLGVPYVYGGASPSGFDCSGFVMYVYNHFGISLPHGATPMVNCGTAVSKSDLIPGDLVIFSSSSAVYGHVGIYIGDGEFIHASSGKGYVIISGLSESYYSRMYQCARRVL